jgi:sulfite reductase (NADPH) flavoprotein alpha-component
MTIQLPIPARPILIPENAPFTAQQRAWLNGFFSGLLAGDAVNAVSPIALSSVPMGGPAGAEDTAPWHDAAMPMAERVALAKGLPVRRQMFAAMAQQDCGQCGYLCESYADLLADGMEVRANLCVPGGKDTTRALKALLAAALPQPAGKVAALTPTVAPVARVATMAGTSRETAVAVQFVSSTVLNGVGSEKDTRHIVFNIAASGLDYAPGDSFGILPRNDPQLVDAVLAAIDAPADFPMGGKTLRAVLLEDYALGAAPDMLFELTSYLIGGDRRQIAKAMAKGEDPDGDLATLDVLGALEKFGPLRPDPEAFLETLEPLQPRLYSISSSPVAHAGELHLTVDCVRYEVGGRQRLGVASTHVADRLMPGDAVQVYVQKAHNFALPAHGDTPIVMVGPGTGLAPFRSFLWHRQATGGTGPAWLFYGHQREATDYFYRDELKALTAQGVLTKLSLAWSRDGAEKVYVQDRIRSHGPELWTWLKRGAHLYVCGDAKRMAKDVEAAIVEISGKAGQMSEAGARDFLAELKVTGRYQADVY